ncbi:hypothetical protein SAMN05216389_11296 [Oceanobacillus limi]|uniref:HTH HARE-type domain-containing protein n=1 Tax=Oceanobacillus limi TaxID=930131 RepID=A0A1I0EV33_9BACI|nr:HTH domain-containing protein [Oceanobacillus limi]SET48739.1 hypothetical protein SAMN05216389_11296 [Oceanobacillus limi]
MSDSYTLTELAIETLKSVGKPLSSIEIWKEAEKLDLTRRTNSSGKTPWATIGARIYTDIKDNSDTPFVQVSKRPAKFFIKDQKINNRELIAEVDNDIHKEVLETEAISFYERDLHPLLAKFLYSNTHFACLSKTIYHESSRKSQKGYNKWLHPDMVGVYFPFNDYLKETQRLQESFKISSFKLFSFELKVKITFSNLREYYFQAVSNSSWANEGYLVALEIDSDPLLKDELRRLNNSFGIGVVILNPVEIEQSDIFLPAKAKEAIDWDTIDRLADENKDFKNFILDLTEDIQLGKVKSNYDKLLSDNELENYIKDKGIRNLAK